MKQQVMASKRSEEVGKEDDEACAASCLTGETLVGRLKRNRRKPKCGDPMLSSIAIPEKKIRVRFSMLKKQQQLGLLLLNQEHICDEHSLDYHSYKSGNEGDSDSPKQGNTVNNTGSNTNEDHDDRENPGENRDVVDDDGVDVDRHVISMERMPTPGIPIVARCASGIDTKYLNRSERAFEHRAAQSRWNSTLVHIRCTTESTNSEGPPQAHARRTSVQTHSQIAATSLGH